MFKKDKSKYIALSVSLGVHVVLFAVLAIIQFSRPTANAQTHNVSAASISKALQSPMLIPKPKVTSSSSAYSSNLTADDIQIDASALPDVQPVDLPMVTSISTPGLLPDITVTADNVTEFFGTASTDRKIVYVVDISGSMLGLLTNVRAQLRSSISALKPDCYFYIVFFGDGKLFESGNGKLTRATPSAKRKAYAFIDSVKAGGSTNALVALERAMRIKDSSSRPAGRIFFLTDGFDLADGESQTFASSVENLRKRLAPSARINTIGFWMEQQDRLLIERIAAKSSGEFVNVE